MDGINQELEYSVPGMTCAHCEAAVKQEVAAVNGVVGVVIDLGAKRVSVSGEELDDAAIMAAIDQAGYDAERV